MTADLPPTSLSKLPKNLHTRTLAGLIGLLVSSMASPSLAGEGAPLRRSNVRAQVQRQLRPSSQTRATRRATIRSTAGNNLRPRLLRRNSSTSNPSDRTRSPTARTRPTTDQKAERRNAVASFGRTVLTTGAAISSFYLVGEIIGQGTTPHFGVALAHSMQLIFFGGAGALAGLLGLLSGVRTYDHAKRGWGRAPGSSSTASP